ncbi:TetR/AcrR family transcriptional regulator [Novosphingobium sp. M1R2S20]|uniref:TetR/AcrR family transcriptional regulator n=1 Tax=Novosphingobium rhizovicinum TaxID=3228928 RepID=A0ABV3REA6_9SPHN
MRWDARNSREKLIAAAAKVMRERGHTVPLQEVIDAAGLGRGTLYRHFADRESLIIAVIEHDLDAASELIETSADSRTLFFDFLETRSASAAAFLPALLSIDSERLRSFTEATRPRYDALLSTVVDRAREAGVIRHDYTPQDLALTIEMLSLARQRCSGERSRLPARLLDFLMQGVGSRTQEPLELEGNGAPSRRS